MENGFSSQSLSHPALVLAGLPEALRMQLGPFNPQLQDAKGLNLHSLNASAFRLRYANNYPGFPAHLIHHLQPQLFPTAVDPRVHFTAGAFRPFNVSSSPNKLFPSAFAPPHKSETHSHESSQELSPGNYVSKLYGSENEEESGFRSHSDRDIDIQSTDQSSKSDLPRSTAGSTPSPKAPSVKEDKTETGKGYEPSPSNVESDNSSVSNSEDERGMRRGKVQFDPTCCPICGIMVLLGEAESHFFKELERLSQLTAMTRDRKYLLEKSGVHPCFSFGNSYLEENGHSSDTGMPRGRWETYQRIKSNRLSRLRIKNRRRKSGDPLCPVCNEKMQGNVEDINLHVEHCLKKHSDEADDDEEENIDVEGDSEVYGEYEWAGRHLIRATTFLVGGFAGTGKAAGLLTTASTSNHRNFEKEEENLAVDGDDSSTLTPIHLSDPDVHMTEEESPQERESRDRDSPSTSNSDIYVKLKGNASSK